MLTLSQKSLHIWNGIVFTKLSARLSQAIYNNQTVPMEISEVVNRKESQPSSDVSMGQEDEFDSFTSAKENYKELFEVKSLQPNPFSSI